MTEADYDRVQAEPWSNYRVNPNDFKVEVLDELSTSIFVKEHKMRWPVEQRERRQTSIAVLARLDWSKLMIGGIVEIYNIFIHKSVDASHLYTSPQIPGPKTSLRPEKSPFDIKGLADLKVERKENHSIINRIMLYIHN